MPSKRKPKPIRILTTMHPLEFGVDRYMEEYLPVLLVRTDKSGLEEFQNMSAWCREALGDPFIARDENHHTVLNLTHRWNLQGTLGFRFATKGDAMMAKLANEGFKIDVP